MSRRIFLSVATGRLMDFASGTGYRFTVGASLEVTVPAQQIVVLDALVARAVAAAGTSP